MGPEGSLPHSHVPATKRPFYGEELLVSRLTHKLEDHPLSAVRDLRIQYIHSYTPYFGPGSVVGIATGYGLDSPGIESR